MRPREAVSPDFGTLYYDFRLLVILFVSLRLILLLAYTPMIVDALERGVSAGGDFATYFQLGALSEQGLLPFRDWWSEFPPIPSILDTMIYQLGGRSSYTGFAALFGLLMLGCECGNLSLVRSIGRRIHGPAQGTGLAWIYALLGAPLVLMWWSFEPLVAFVLLLAVHQFLIRRVRRAALIVGFGTLVKFTPVVALAAAVRFRAARSALFSCLIAAAVFFGVYLLLGLQNISMTAPSLTAQFSKASYQSVWALIDGNYRTGNFGPIEERFDPRLAAELQGNPARIPGVVRLAAAALIGAFVFAQVRRFDDAGFVQFTAIALLIFFLQSQGWSPQWLCQIVPLLLLCFPTRDGIMGITILSLIVFAEYPFLWVRTGDTGGVMSGNLILPFALLVIARTVLLTGFAVGLYRKLRVPVLS